MSHILSDEQFREYQDYKKTGYTPKQLKVILRDLDPDEAPNPLIDNSTPTPDDFWNDK